MAPRNRLAVVPDPVAQRDRPPDLRDAVRASVDAMDWLTPTDQAMRALALRQAEEIERAADRTEELAAILRDAGGNPDIYKRVEKLAAMCEMTKAVGWLGPQLQGTLRDLGGTPAARAAMKKDKPVGSRLAQLRGDADKAD